MKPTGQLKTRAAPRDGLLYPQLVESGTAGLSERIRAGDGAAFEQFFRELYPALVAFLRRRTGSAALAEDIAQDVFVALWERRSGIDPARSLRAYLFRAASNAAVSHGRRRRLEERVRGWLRLRPEHGPSADAELYGDELRVAVSRAVGALPPRCRDVFLLARDAHMSYAEIALALGLAPKTVENHMGRALKLLRDALRPLRS